MKTRFQGIFFIFLLTAITMTVSGRDFGQTEISMWQTAEWSIEQTEPAGNPFDAVAKVTFKHQSSDREHTTEMFYDGEGDYRFRFCGTLAGDWDFESQSKIPALDGHSGTVRVAKNTNPSIKGFVTHVGNTFAVQVKDASDLQAYVFNVFMSRVKHPAFLDEFGPDLEDAREKAGAYFNNVMHNGFEIIFIHVNNNWFKHGARKYSEHNSENPDPTSFAVLEEIITTVYQLGGRVHIWAWGDESRQWTPKGLPGGIHGEADRRLMRYIAARLGPLPGWTMGYGFDLHEWTNSKQLNAWARYLHRHFGWQHLLCARGHILEGPDNMNSYDGFGRDVQLKTTPHGPADYAEIVEDLASDKQRPHFYEERHSYKRSGFDLDMDGTRRLLWEETMAGGMGGFFGFYPDSPYPYPNPEQLRIHYRFWHEQQKFTLDMEPANKLIEGGVALFSPSTGRCILYQKETDTVRVDLSRLSGRYHAFAVDTVREGDQIDIGGIDTSKKEWIWKAPRQSDWVFVLEKGGFLKP